MTVTDGSILSKSNCCLNKF